jgi:hypothetical protein
VTVSAPPPFSWIETATENKLCKESAKFEVRWRSREGRVFELIWLDIPFWSMKSARTIVYHEESYKKSASQARSQRHFFRVCAVAFWQRRYRSEKVEMSHQGKVAKLTDVWSVSIWYFLSFHHKMFNDVVHRNRAREHHGGGQLSFPTWKACR